ncbi:TonB-dependent receptor [Sphingomonas sp. MAH-20]|uniref:TonB-dependent receptor n=1 Tax=Sphingomonas horti TaxID=2682842 RepID=A0A6I4J405_9SPHN|nr:MULTISPECIES: TonB-dependent receptor [Sphingomonas]MBA2921251.1 TonB-dependent receptor [Sphingomonas sp. CGMCC 1.13658]MVO79492.1 TonB-dependent receptor [Sphingomonas horti]
MIRPVQLSILCTVLLGGTLAHPAKAADDTLVYPAAFFAEAQPANAYDMILRLPGFQFDEGDADVRGLSGAAGNVLVDGRRPAAKADRLDAILKRIPAASVLRIELIRGGAQGIDMQGYSVLANVMRRSEAAVRGQAEATFARYGDGRLSRDLRADISRRSGDRVSEASLYLYQTIDDEKGRGPRIRTNADRSIRERAIYDEHDGFRGARATLGHERRFVGGRLQLSASASRERERADTDLTFLAPDPGLERVLELETKDNLELGLNWNRSIGKSWSVGLTGLQRLSRDNASEQSDDGAETEAVAERAKGGESIGRAVLRWKPSATLSLEGGGEAAYNYLDSHSALAIDSVAVPLPAANVRVAERRVEGFATATWQPSRPLTIEAGIRVEASRLTQSGDSSLVKSFVFPKPRLAIAWSSGPYSQWRLRVEREVSQLDFGDFVSSTSLTSSTITAGNVDLEPERTWIASLAWERRFRGDGALVLTARHEWKSHTLDRVGVIGPDFAFDAPGNIGSGAKSKIAADLNLPLDRLGIAGGLLRAELGYRWTSVVDPTTGERRRISGEQPIDGEIHFTQDRPAAGFRWGIDYLIATDEIEYRFNEIRRTRIAGRLSVFAEYKLAPRWTVRAFAENLTGRHVERSRAIYAGSRAALPLRYVEVRDLGTRPLVGILVRRSFGAQ